MVVVPSNRLVDTIGHVYLDAIEKKKGWPYIHFIWVQYIIDTANDSHSNDHGHR